MQVLKDQVRNRIITSAKSEFLEKGFAHASMRVIAENSEITVGNIYRYFSSKQSLFEEVVRPAYLSLKGLLESIQINEEIPLPPERYQVIREKFVGEISDAISKYHGEILILFNGTAGTNYEDAINEVSKLIFDVLEKYVMVPLASRKSVQNLKALGRLISNGLVEAINDLLLRVDNSEKEILVSELRTIIDFYFRDLVTRFD
ncbi:TetR/AcrR family transcriptional regulator [Acidaminobacter hydrogenoformans]|uniref:Transcriptional regulator, TetR family n=1 Tax=Acidaminobacter hydrogenoformans DSM 2784 TaxID=1120920 RepID=A0A1G5RSU8_9FIRM|nr:TetR/AcrR family transcriptional regulator [Acidaminobacter hydrogenoformans]SCZ77087.1 transcriptional regulator, TetR family [Acidaminobacter hydrogenoformans DSM 2784]